MKFSIALLLAPLAFIGLADAVSTSQCNADNCARAATGTAGGMFSSRVAACSSFQRCTVTEAATTVTTTSTITVAPAMAGLRIMRVAKRQATAAPGTCPSSVPSFATSACNSSRYQSACSCFGITRTTTTVAGSTSTVTSVTTVTATAPRVTGTTGKTTPFPTGTAPSGGFPVSTAANSTVNMPALPATLVDRIRL